MDEDRIDPEFSFAGHMRDLRGGMSRDKLRDLMELGTMFMEDDNPLVKAMKRGIGVHHSGLPLKYRQVVEILFRCGYLRVVIATGDKNLPVMLSCFNNTQSDGSTLHKPHRQNICCH